MSSLTVTRQLTQGNGECRSDTTRALTKMCPPPILYATEPTSPDQPSMLFALFAALVLPVLAPRLGTAQGPPECSVAWQPYFTQHFTPSKYLGDQVWAFRQAADGSVFAASSVGMVRLDGQGQERAISGHGERPVYSLDIDDQDQVYYGGYRDFGVVVADSSGKLVARSLLPGSGVDPDSISYVWTTLATAKQVVFQTPERIVAIASDGSVKTWAAPGRLHNAFRVGDRVFVRVVGHGLFELTTTGLRLIPGGELFSGMRIFMMHETENGALQIGTNERGIFTSNGAGFEHVPTALDTVSPGVRRYHGIVLADGKMAIATLGDGVLLLGPAGELLAHLTHDSPNKYVTPLNDDVVNYVYSDAHNGLWVAYNNAGASRIDICSPLNQIEGIGGIRAFDEAGDRLYVSTGASVLMIDRYTGFTEEIAERLSWSAQECNDRLLISTENSIALYARAQSKGRNSVRLLDRLSTDGSASKPRVLRRSSRTNGCVFLLGSTDGIWELSIENDRIGNPKRLVNANEVREILEVGSDELLFVERFHGVKRWQRGRGSVADSVAGIPEGSVMVKLALVRGAPTAFPDNDPDAYRYSEVLGRFEKLEYLRDTVSTAVPEAVGVGADGGVWKVFADSVEWWRPHLHDGFSRFVPSLLRLPLEKTDLVHVDKDGVVWYNTARAIVRYDPSIVKDYSAKFYTRILSASTTRGIGVIASDVSQARPQRNSEVRIEPGYGSIIVSYSAAHFNRPELAAFRYRIRGYSDEWSEWSSSTTALISDLSHGRYIFEVEARNAHGYMGEIARLAFWILPPWYQTLWAYCLFVGLAVGLVSILVHYRRLAKSHRLAAHQAEELAREREYVSRLTEANDQLRKASRMRDEFLATTSHELRTPITAVLGSAEVLKGEIPSGSPALEFVSIIEESGRRLEGTLRDMVDIARLRSGTIELDRHAIRIAPIAERVASRFREEAGAKGIALRVVSGTPEAEGEGDEIAVERILEHLIGNAMKFTDHGTITVETDDSEISVEVRIRDTGAGIDESFLPHLFEEFKQESAGEARLYGGTGLGLAISAGFAKLMAGSITVSSIVGVGSVFTLSIPKSHGVGHQDPTDLASAGADRGPVERRGTERRPDREAMQRAGRWG